MLILKATGFVFVVIVLRSYQYRISSKNSAPRHPLAQIGKHYLGIVPSARGISAPPVFELRIMGRDGFSRGGMDSVGADPSPKREKLTDYFAKLPSNVDCRATGVTTLPAAVPADVCATSPCSPEASGWETT